MLCCVVYDLARQGDVMTPRLISDPHDSCHHADTSEGDTFGGLGTTREFREEDMPRKTLQPPTPLGWLQHPNSTSMEPSPVSNHITMYDAVTVNNIPHYAEAVAGYTGGKWPTFKELTVLFSRALKLSIAISASEDGECLDIENGDATPAQAPVWFRRQKLRNPGVVPCFYASLSVWPELFRVLAAAGIHRSEYRAWVAHYDGVAVVPQGFDAKQYWDKALGEDLDISVCHPEFFGPSRTPFVEPNEARWEREYDAVATKKGAWPALRRRVLKRAMLHQQRRIVQLAEKTGWSVLNRRDRYRKLYARTLAR